MPWFLILRRALRNNWQIVAIPVLLGACVIAMGAFFSVRGEYLMEQQLREKLKSTAAIAAMQFDGNVVDRTRGPNVMKSGDFRDIVQRLRQIRENIPTIRYAYIMRKTADPMTLEFVADADSLSSPAELDRNRDGTLDESEAASYAGDLYGIREVPALQGAAFAGPAVDEEFTTDAWGTVMSAYAPVRTPEGKIIAVLGLDMDAESYVMLSKSIFSNVALLVLCIAAVLFAVLIGTFLWQRRVESKQRIDEERSGLMLLTLHQIGSPLTVFQWSLETLQEEMQKNGEHEHALQEHAKNMRHGIAHLRRILEELQEATQVDAGTLAYHREWVKVPEIIQNVIDSIKHELELRKQTIVQNVDSSISLSLDRKLVTGVLRELLQNAMMFSTEGSKIAVSAKKSGKKILVEVSDSGCGIPRGDLVRIFDKFTRGSNAHLYQPNGSGLGLYIAHGIIKRAGGEMWVRSKEGRGTTVTFTLPA